MKLPKKWLCDYVDFNVSNEEFIERMMWRGFELAGVEPELPGVSGVVTGQVLSMRRHENADKLQVCQVDVGKEALTVVTGAGNVREGDFVPVATVGAVLGGRTLEQTNMRGVMSHGMLCSGKELGLTDADYPGSEADGILILQKPYPLGQPIAKALGMDDVIFDFDLTPNRPDCQSIIGLCREAAAALGQPFAEPAIQAFEGAGDEAEYARVSVWNTELCPRYTARVVKDIRIAPSPAWMQRRLKSVGLRPINNIVDITNYVLVEYGHPMHAFDLACIEGAHIIVRNAYENEVVTTLDGKARPVTPDMLLIADEARGVGIAGVMGGENSEITEHTEAILFESAVFKGSNIRATSRKLRHTTDAAARFIKGVEPVNAKKALDRAVELVVELCAGTLVGSTIDVCAADLREREMDIDCAHVNRLLNLDLSAGAMADMLATINIPAVPEGDSRMRIRIPHYRTDIESGIEADWDIAEEIARIYGYDRIPPTLMRGDTFRGGLNRAFRFDDRVKDTLAALGFYEMYNYNFTGPARLDALRLPAGSELRQAVRLLNPFGEDQSLMRTTLLIGMLESAARNINFNTGVSRFFEVGNVHLDNNDTLPEERKNVGMVVFGEAESFFTLKGAIESLFDRLGVRSVRYVRSESPYFQPGRAAIALAENGAALGEFGDVHPDVARSFGIGCRVMAAELSFANLLDSAVETKRFKPLPRFPLVSRDLAVVVDASVESAALKAVIERADAGVIVEDVRLFDSYAGPGIPPGCKSLAFSFTLRADDHTLSDAEIRTAMDAIILALKNVGAPLRA